VVVRGYSAIPPLTRENGPNPPVGGPRGHSTGTNCKTAGSAYVGSNPTPATARLSPLGAVVDRGRSGSRGRGAGDGSSSRRTPRSPLPRTPTSSRRSFWSRTWRCRSARRL